MKSERGPGPVQSGGKSRALVGCVEYKSGTMLYKDLYVIQIPGFVKNVALDPLLFLVKCGLSSPLWPHVGPKGPHNALHVNCTQLRGSRG